MAWVFSLIGYIGVGLSGIVPSFILPFDQKLTKDVWTRKLNPFVLMVIANFPFHKLLKSIGGGGLLGHVFLNLLPDAWGREKRSISKGYPGSGCWVLFGMLTFVIIDQVNTDRGFDIPSEGYFDQNNKHKAKITFGHLNLMTNIIDNFTNGLYVAGAFLISFDNGVDVTSVIILHGLLYELTDFIILLFSGFSLMDAVLLQICTATAGLIGAAVAIADSSVKEAMESRFSWITPFTAGGFLYIALFTILPDILKEKDVNESIKQFLGLIFGIAMMLFLKAALY